MNSSRFQKQLDNVNGLDELKVAILWGGDNLIAKALESLLASVNTWRVVKIHDDHDVRTLAREVEKINPKMVFISLDGCDAGLSTPAEYVKEAPEFKVVTINPVNNCVEVFTRQVFWIKDMSDLLSIVDEHSDPASKGGNAP